MAIGPNQAGSGPRPFWRRLVGALAIYALVTQPLLLMIAGPQLAQAAALEEISLSQPCLHNPNDSPVTPAKQNYPAYHHHCIQCYAGAFQLIDAPQPVIVASINPAFCNFRHAGLGLHLPPSSKYSVARPRGPPPAA